MSICSSPVLLDLTLRSLLPPRTHPTRTPHAGDAAQPGLLSPGPADSLGCVALCCGSGAVRPPMFTSTLASAHSKAVAPTPTTCNNQKPPHAVPNVSWGARRRTTPPLENLRPSMKRLETS